MDHHGSILLAPEIKGVPVNEVTMKFKDIEDHKASIKVRWCLECVLFEPFWSNSLSYDHEINYMWLKRI